MNVDELNTAVIILRSMSVYIGNTILQLKERGFIINDGKYCKLRICQWLINLFNKHIFDNEDSTVEEDKIYEDLMNHMKVYS